MSTDEQMLVDAVRSNPDVLKYLDWPVKARYYKAAPISREELENRLARLIGKVDRAYLAELEANGGRVSYDFWAKYEADLRAEISTPLRGYIEQSFVNSSDYANFIDTNGAVDDINTAMTQAISRTAQGVAQNTRAQLEALLQSGLTEREVVESIALRFSSGHAAQVAITELTRAEAQFSEALSSGLEGQGVATQIRLTTSVDERVCPICGPADHKLKDQPITTATGGWNGQTWGARFGGPPFHPNCRCQTNVELRRG